MKYTLTFILGCLIVASCAEEKKKEEFELKHVSSLTLSPVRLVARLEGDTLEIIPNEIMYVKIAGTIYQVEAAGRWHRMVYYKGDCDGRNRMKHAVNAADLKCDPYYKAFEPDTCCFCDDSLRARVVIGTMYHNGGNFINLDPKKKIVPIIDSQFQLLDTTLH